MTTDEDHKKYYREVGPLLRSRASERQLWIAEALNEVLYTYCSDKECIFCRGDYSAADMAIGAGKIVNAILTSEYEAGVGVTALVAMWSSHDLATMIRHHPDGPALLEDAQAEVAAEGYRRRKMAEDKFAAWQRGEVKY